MSGFIRCIPDSSLPIVSIVLFQYRLAILMGTQSDCNLGRTCVRTRCCSKRFGRRICLGRERSKIIGIMGNTVPDPSA
jgi:hypothetical protein